MPPSAATQGEVDTVAMQDEGNALAPTGFFNREGGIAGIQGIPSFVWNRHAGRWEDDDGCSIPRRRRRALGIRHLLAPDVRRILAHREIMHRRGGGKVARRAKVPGRAQLLHLLPGPEAMQLPPTRGGSFAACPAGRRASRGPGRFSCSGWRRCRGSRSRVPVPR